MHPNPKGISVHIPVLIFLQVCFIILFVAFTRYDKLTGYKHQNSGEYGKGSDHPHNMTLNIYPAFQDVHVMIFMGFGFLMTFLKRYGLSAVSLNFMLGALCIQWSILVQGFLHLHFDQCHEEGILEKRAAEKEEIVFNKFCDPNKPWIDINLITLIGADFACAVVLISFGVLIGTVSPLQLIVLTMIEIVLFNVNEVIGRQYFGTRDAGDTIFVHMFGAYYGLAISRVLYTPETVDNQNKKDGKTSNLFSMVGTLFLWVYWPSFNGGTAATGDGQQRALINTYLSLAACTISTFAVSALVNHRRQFVMEHIQNATLAGGVAVGAVADMILTPGGAIVTGTVAGAISTLGFEFVTPFLQKKLKISDTCGVHNLHGMPAILGGLLSWLIAGIATGDTYDQFNVAGDSPDQSSLYEIFPLNLENSETWTWTGRYQAWMQAAGMGVTLAMAIVGGLITGYVLKWIQSIEQRHLEKWNKDDIEYLYNDDLYIFEEEEDSEEEAEEDVKGKINQSFAIEMQKVLMER